MGVAIYRADAYWSTVFPMTKAEAITAFQAADRAMIAAQEAYSLAEEDLTQLKVAVNNASDAREKAHSAMIEAMREEGGA